MSRNRILRVLAAGMVLAGGLIHLDLWNGGYRSIPRIGPLFLLNVGASALIALALLASGRRLVLFAGVVVSVVSLAALVTSRTVGLLGFMETWTDDAIRVLGAELAALAAVAALATEQRARRLA